MKYITLILVLITPSLGWATETYTGPAKVIDGDTISINGTIIELAFIDAPELGQRCWEVYPNQFGKPKYKNPFDGGIVVKEKLQEILGDQNLTCHRVPILQKQDIRSKERMRLKDRIFASCSTIDGTNPSIELAKLGLIYPYNGGRKSIYFGDTEPNGAKNYHQVSLMDSKAEREKIGFYNETNRRDCEAPYGFRPKEDKLFQ